jgi:hypothetical protein
MNPKAGVGKAARVGLLDACAFRNNRSGLVIETLSLSRSMPGGLDA